MDMKVVLGLSVAFVLLFSVAYSYDISAQKPDTSDGDWVYLIKSQNPVLQNQLGVRHNFDVGFTTTLNEHQVAGLQKAGFVLERQVLYQLTAPPGACTPWPDCKNGGDGGDGGTTETTRPATPSTQFPWGVKTIYNSDSPSPSGGGGIKVAVLDTGVNTEHFDLKNRVADCKDFTKTDRQGNPKDSCSDNNGHGTHVAGTILADGGSDGKGIFGVAPEASLMAYKVCGGGGCWSDDIASAINHSRAEGAHIISMSLGGDSPNNLIRTAVNAAHSNVLIIAAAGNDGPSGGSIDYPGAFAQVVAVGAIDSNLNVPSWSSRGIDDNDDSTIVEKEVEVAAPGVSVYSTWKDGAYNTISGTSMATPHISGLAAKLWQGSAELTRAHLQSIANDIFISGYDTATGYGLPQVP